MPPDPDHPFDPEDIPFFFDNWCSLPWSPWIPFRAPKEEFRQIPKEPGLYRIRPAGRDFLMYIGGTGRTLHQRLHNLRVDLENKKQMPWTDPHTEGPALWAFTDAEGYGYECSASPLDASAGGRKGMESFLLYRYRQERGASPICNFGRFHLRYRMSTNRKEGVRGGRLAGDRQDNPAGRPGSAPLAAKGKPGDSTWMGLAWTAWQPLEAGTVPGVPAGAGLYLLADPGSHEIVYIGRSADVAQRLLDHTRKTRGEGPPEFSCWIASQPVLPHILWERETDLIGNYVEQFRKAPEFQFRDSR